MLTVRTKWELEQALERRENHILFEGPKAQELVSRLEEEEEKASAARGIGVGLGILCLIAAPFTCGGSLLGLGASVGAIALSETVIIAIIAAIVQISKSAIEAIRDYQIKKLDNYRVEFIRK